jgi:hypothetical protein
VAAAWPQTQPTLPLEGAQEQTLVLVPDLVAVWFPRNLPGEGIS